MAAKILYLITELDIGGAEKNLFRLAVGLKDRGWDVSVAALSGRGEVGKWLDAAGVPVHYVEMRSKLEPRWFARLVRLLRRERPDILHTFLFHANAAGRLANLFARVPAVVSSVRVAERRRKSHLYVDFLTQALVDAEICVSEGVREFTARRARISESKLVVIPNPVEPLETTRTRDETRRELGASTTDKVVLSVGRLDVQKGYEYLISAATGILRRRSDVIFAVAGEGPARGALEEAVRAAGIAERFRLLGWRADVADLYSAADVFVLPSLWEGMPNALLEAATFALPMVATDVEGTREIVEDGRAGLIVPPGDAAALEGAIERVLADRGLAQKIGQAVREYVGREHGMEAFLEAHESLYRRLLER